MSISYQHLTNFPGSPVDGCVDYILLHGWSNNASHMDRWAKVVQNDAQGQWSIWNLTYPTDVPFRQSAGAIAAQLNALRAQGVAKLEKVRIIAYSMGGLVARQMIASGFPVTKLATFCTPHQGLLPPIWWHVLNAGVQSMHPDSADLKNLNADNIDKGKRNCYRFEAVTSSSNGLELDDDGVVAEKSARGDDMVGKIRRNSTAIEYHGAILPWEPHGEGLNPIRFAKGIDFILT